MQLYGCDIVVRLGAGIRRQRRGRSGREGLDGRGVLGEQCVDVDRLGKASLGVASAYLVSQNGIMYSAVGSRRGRGVRVSECGS